MVGKLLRGNVRVKGEFSLNWPSKTLLKTGHSDQILEDGEPNQVLARWGGAWVWLNYLAGFCQNSILQGSVQMDLEEVSEAY